MKICAEDVLRNTFVGKTLIGIEFCDRKFHNKIIGLNMVYEISPEVDKIANAFTANPHISLSPSELAGDGLDASLPKFRTYPDPAMQNETVLETEDDNSVETVDNNSSNPVEGISQEVVDLIHSETRTPTKDSGIILQLENFEEIFVEKYVDIEVE